MTQDTYQKIFEGQQGLCPICNEPPTSGNPFVVDHDHSCCPGRKSCGKCIRGLLHRTCNAAIGLLKDSEEILLNAVVYLRKENASKK